MTQQGGRDVEDRVRAAFVVDGGIDPDTNFFEAGITSSSLAQALEHLQVAGFEVALVDLYRWPTVSALVTEIRRRTGASRVVPVPTRDLPWLRRPS